MEITRKSITIRELCEGYVNDSEIQVEAAVEANDKEAAVSALKVASTEIDKACSKGVFHKNNAARKISRLTNLVNAMN